MQRTVDENMHCEEGKWNDCYKDKGDYLDGHSYGNHKHPVGLPGRSGAMTGCMNLLVALVLAALY